MSRPRDNGGQNRIGLIKVGDSLRKSWAYEKLGTARSVRSNRRPRLFFADYCGSSRVERIAKGLTAGRQGHPGARDGSAPSTILRLCRRRQRPHQQRRKPRPIYASRSRGPPTGDDMSKRAKDSYQRVVTTAEGVALRPGCAFITADESLFRASCVNAAGG